MRFYCSHLHRSRDNENRGAINEPGGVSPYVCSYILPWFFLTFAIGGQEKEQLPSAVINILAHLFDCCRAEVRRILQVRVDGLQRFVGTTEAVVLGDCHANGSTAAGDRLGGARAGAAADAGEMAADTEELLYGELRRRYRTIAGLTRNQLVALSAGVLSHALTTKAEKEFGRMLLHQTWPLFEQVARSYLALFVEVRRP